MDPTITTPYGYVPTLWFAIVFDLSIVLSIATLIPLLYKRNIALCILAIAGLVFQFVGHTGMAVSAQLPASIPPWIVQRLAFALGKLSARVVVMYAYYACFSRISDIKSSRRVYNFHVVIYGFWISAFIARFVGISLEIAALLTDVSSAVSTIVSVASSGVLVATTLGFSMLLVWVITKSRKDVPWHQLTWMLVYYVILQTVPFFILTQDIFDFVAALVSYRNEMVELLCDMGMTKMILVMLASQAYEIAQAWEEKRPKYIEKLEMRVKEIIALWKEGKGV